MLSRCRPQLVSGSYTTKNKRLVAFSFLLFMKFVLTYYTAATLFIYLFKELR